MRRSTCFSVSLSSILSLMLCLGAVAQTQPPTGTPPTGGTPTTGRPTTGTTTTPNTGTQPQRPTMPGDDNDPFNQGRGIKGRIIPSPGQRLNVELYLDGIRLDQTFTDM